MINDNDIQINVIDKGQGMRISGWQYAITILHKPTGIFIELPRQTGQQHIERALILDALDNMLLAIDRIQPVKVADKI